MRCLRYPLLFLALSGGCAGKPTTARSAATPGYTLSSHDVRAGIAPVKANARACGVEHGAEPGAEVRVKFVVFGPTGRVKSAEAMSPWTGTPLGECVTAAIAEAQFRRCEAETIGVVYPIIF